MICITEERKCCGCAACVAVCPAKCIEMVTGTLGAVFPKVDVDKCLGCGKCDAVCPIQNADEMKKIPNQQPVYAAYSKDADLRKRGSSGGMFGAFATQLISRGFRVYGAGFDEKMQLRCMYADSIEALAPLMKSKYLQSDLSGAYSQILKDLQQGKQLLFISTPCQVAALKRFLKKDYDNLLTVDFLCHGVPSQQLFDQCKDYEEKKRNCNIVAYNFRTKIPNGATPHYYTVVTEKNSKIKSVTKPYFRSPFYAFFQKYISLRESCYNCTFAERGRVSDITIADFHAIEKYVPGINRFEGVSTVIINTEKGKRLFEDIQDRIWFKPFSMEQLISDKVLFAEKTARPAGRDRFIISYNTLAFHEFIERNLDKKRYAIYAVYYKLPKILRSIAKRIFHIE